MKSEIQISETIQSVLKEEGWRMYEINKIDGQKCSYYETAIAKDVPDGDPYFILFSFDGTDNDFMTQIRRKAKEFDPEERATEQIFYGLIDRTSEHILDVINEAMAIQDMMFELACVLERRLKEVNG